MFVKDIFHFVDHKMENDIEGIVCQKNDFEREFERDCERVLHRDSRENCHH